MQRSVRTWREPAGKEAHLGGELAEERGRETDR